MSIIRGLALFLLILPCAGGFALAVVDLPVMPREVAIDGRITKQEIDGAGVTSLTLLGSLDRAKHATDAYLFVNDSGLYVGFDCKDPKPDSLVTKTKEGSGVFEDDSVELYVAPAKEATRNNYFHFAVNAANVAYSSNLATEIPVDRWEHAASRTEDGWQVEMFIPLASLGGSTDLSHWRGNLARNYPTRPGGQEEQSSWANTGITLHNYKRFGFFRLIQTPFPEIADLTRPTPAPGRTAMPDFATTGSNPATTIPAPALVAPEPARIPGQ
jgi:hypothetical protein